MSSKKKKNPNSGDGGGGSMDERFQRIQKDPRFWEMPEREQKIKIDKRFQSMFHDDRFKVKYTVDKRGRPMNHTSTDDLRRFYKLSESEEDDDEEEKSDKIKKDKKKKKEIMTEKRGKTESDDDEDDEEEEEDDDDEDVTDDDDIDESEEEEEEEDDEDKEEREIGSGSEDEEESSGLESDEDSGPDLARGKGNIETSSDEDDEDDIDVILRKEEEEIEHDWGELCKDAPRTEAISARLAVCNMDWDRIKARDLLALFNSFLPKGGAVLSVKIYPSDFGKERLKTEETQGPLELKALPEDSEDDNEEEKVYREKMRDYQFKRLKYYYAVVQCDSVDTAAKIYQECDGYEYESSCSVIDLRFIPDDVTFDEEPKDAATDVNLVTYTPKVFTSSAASTSKVQLTWDETDHDRVTALNRKFNKEELLDMDFKAYLASSSEEEEEDEEVEDEEERESADDAVAASEADETEEGATAETVVKESEEEEQPKNQKSRQQRQQKKPKKEKSEEQLSKYRDLLRGIQDKEKKLQEDKDMEMEITWVPGLKETTEQLVKKKMEVQDPLTPWEEFLHKKKEKKKQKKSQRKIQGAESDEDLSDDELPPDVDLSDPFFAEELKATDLKKKKKEGKKKMAVKTQEEEEELEKQKAEMALLMDDDADEAKHKHFNYDKIVEQQNLSKKKRKKLLKKGEEPLDSDDFQVDVADPRFQAMFTSHLFNLDPSNPNFKKTKATQSILAEKQRRREVEEQRQREVRVTTHETPVTQKDSAHAGNKRQNDSDAPVEKKKELDPSLSLLVKSIKSKTQQFQARKKPKLA